MRAALQRGYARARGPHEVAVPKEGTLAQSIEDRPRNLVALPQPNLCLEVLSYRDHLINLLILYLEGVVKIFESAVRMFRLKPLYASPRTDLHGILLRGRERGEEETTLTCCGAGSWISKGGRESFGAGCLHKGGNTRWKCLVPRVAKTGR